LAIWWIGLAPKSSDMVTLAMGKNCVLRPLRDAPFFGRDANAILDA